MEEVQQTDGSNRDHRAYARFYKKAVPNQEESEDAGRPTCIVKEYVEILTPGDKTNIVDRPARPDDKARFPKQYAAFKNDSNQDEASGTLLSAWAGIPVERVEIYKFHRVMTVEALSTLGESAIQSIGRDVSAAVVRQDKDKAGLFMEASKGNVPLLQLQAQLDAERTARAAQDNLLKEMAAKLEALSGAPLADGIETPKRGRKTKQAE
jgi:hypothetical protein